MLGLRRLVFALVAIIVGHTAASVGPAGVGEEPTGRAFLRSAIDRSGGEAGGAAAGRDALRPGSVISRGLLTLTVPLPDEEVWAEAIEPDGSTQVLGVATAADGTVAVHDESEAATPGVLRASSTDGCRDGAYTTHSTRWRSTMRWYFNRRTTPGNMRRRQAAAALRRAARNIIEARNDCNLPDRVGASADYGGRVVGRMPDITDAGRCTPRDGRNVVAFGTLPSSYLAITCSWGSGGEKREVDIKLNKASFRWVVRIGSTCDRRWSVEAVATHEFGHAFGLSHVDGTLHPNLTMSPTLRACQMSEARLGLGDIRGLERLY